MEAQDVGCRSYHRAGMSRRGFLQVGVLSALGLTLSDFFRMQAACAASGAGGERRVDSVLLIYTMGGVSHIDSFDPKPDAPAEVRGEFSPIPTNVAGVRFTDRVPLLAKQMDKIALIRSVQHAEGDHGVAMYTMLRGYRQPANVNTVADHANTHPTMGAVVARELPEREGLPPYICVPGTSYTAQVNHFTSGFLGPRYAPFLVSSDPSQPNFHVRDLQPAEGLTARHVTDRLTLRQSIETQLSAFESSREARSMDEMYHKAFRILSNPASLKAFDLQSEPEKLRDAYGRNRLGQSCLVGRRLIEAGVPFVTVDDDGWDHHSDVFPQLKKRLPEFDQALAALLQDMHDRGLLKRTLVAHLTDFGRTPTVNKSAGRDHWPGVFSIFFAGAGIRGGQVLGASDATGAEPTERCITPPEIVATIYRFLGIDTHHEYPTSLGRPIPILEDVEPIAEFI